LATALTPGRLGGELLAECLCALGADVVFGLPGIHALGAWEGMRRRGLRSIVSRTELSAGFAADGYARVSGRPAVLLLSTGPGALNSMTAIMEAASSHVPIVLIVSQIPRELVGQGRGFLHELPDQLASFAPIVKWAASVPSHEALPGLVAAAFREAAAAPSGPVVLEVPVDLLTSECRRVDLSALAGEPAAPPVASERVLGEVARLLGGAERPVLWAGGGVQRSGAWPELVTLAERLGAPVATTYMGKGSIPADHPLAAGSCCDEAAFRELLEAADVLLCVGTELGAETTQQYGLRPTGTVVQVDVAPQRLGASYPVLGVLGDAREVLGSLLAVVADVPRSWGQVAVAALRRRVAEGLAFQGRQLELGLLASIGDAVPDDAVQAWDMTILGYWAAAHHRAPDPRRFLYPLGSGTLGYAFPASLGAAVALPGVPVLAVVGDGGFAYGMAELATARQYGLDTALLVVDSGGYGILREYQLVAYGIEHEVDLVQPDFEGIAAASGVSARVTNAERLSDDLSWAITQAGPTMVLLRERLVAAAATP
jgi:acetolactate synthase-1/2/3 large subunit